MKILKLLFLTILLLIIFNLSSYSQTATVISENTNLRGTPTSKGKIIHILPKDSKVEVIKQKGAWFLIQHSDFVGWVHGNTIKLDEKLSSESVFLPGEYVIQIPKNKESNSSSGKEKVKVVPQHSPTPVANSNEPNEANNSLPVTLTAQDRKNLFSNLIFLKKRLAKDEFETTAEYEKRIAEEIQTPIFDNLTIKDNFSFGSFGVQTEYNADTQKMQFFLPVIDWLNKYNIVFGNYDLYFDALNNLVSTKKSSYYKGFAAELSLDVEEAKRLKSNVKAVIVFKLVEPYANERGAILPNEDPRYEFYARIVDVYFFDPQTGKILIKMSEARK